LRDAAFVASLFLYLELSKFVLIFTLNIAIIVLRKA